MPALLLPLLFLARPTYLPDLDFSAPERHSAAAKKVFPKLASN
jgi:hypothetical protein